MERFVLSRLPRIVFGPGIAADIPGAVARHGRRCLLVTGQRSWDALPLGSLPDDLAAAQVDVVGHMRTSAEPGPETIDGLTAAARRLDVDVVLGIGGGSVLDTAKAVAGLVRTGTSVLDHLEGVGRGVPYHGPALPWVAVPTTAGTGSEVTRNAVLTAHGPTGFKRSFRDERLIATEAIVDPDLLAGCPPALIAANGLDALTQLLEAFTSTRANPVTDALALDGLAAVRDGLLAWHADPAGPDAPQTRARMAYAALLSGICLANAGLGAVHGLAAPIGSLLPIAHGAACGALLIAVTDRNIVRALAGGLTLVTDRYARAGRVLVGLGPGVTDDQACSALVELLRAWTERLGVPRLGELGFHADDIPSVLTNVSTSSMSTNPVPLDQDELGAILRDCL
jgi:alcohol dehydrogenase